VIYKFLQEGGPWMLPILGVSVVGLMFILERAWFWLALWLRSDAGLRRRLLRGEAPAGVETRDPRARVLLVLADRVDDPDRALDRAHLRVLAIASSLGSSLGLFGTVVGMSASFGGVKLSDPGAIIGGLQTALNTTVLGLVVYLATYVAHAMFSQMSSNLGQDLEEELNETRRALLARRAPAALQEAEA
jgi:biopolymer transport protein ExbB/TolQ